MRRDSLPSNARRRPSQTMHFGAQSRGLRAPCERFAPWVTPGPRITRFRLAADLGRMGLDTHRVSNKVSKITSRHLVLLDRAFPAHALVHGSELRDSCIRFPTARADTAGNDDKSATHRFCCPGDYRCAQARARLLAISERHDSRRVPRARPKLAEVRCGPRHIGRPRPRQALPCRSASMLPMQPLLFI